MDADQAPGQRRRPEGPGGSARIGSFATYHGAGDRRRRRCDDHMSSALEYTREYQKKIPYVMHLGLTTESLGEGSARLSMPLPKHFTNSLGTAHGGVIMSLLDVALCTAARTLHPESIGVVTIDMSISFIGGGSGGKLIADARVMKDART